MATINKTILRRQLTEALPDIKNHKIDYLVKYIIQISKDYFLAGFTAGDKGYKCEFEIKEE